MGDAFGQQVAARQAPERRSVDTRQQLIDRIAKEFWEMAGLALTPAQACRLFHMESARCDRVLKELIDRGVVTFNPEGQLIRGPAVL